MPSAFLVNGERVRFESAIIGQGNAAAHPPCPNADATSFELCHREASPNEITDINNPTIRAGRRLSRKLALLLGLGRAPMPASGLGAICCASDAAVDLAAFHPFLRPALKAGRPPIHELSLDRLPDARAFCDRINDFDLIILRPRTSTATCCRSSITELHRGIMWKMARRAAGCMPGTRNAGHPVDRAPRR